MTTRATARNRSDTVKTDLENQAEAMSDQAWARAREVKDDISRIADGGMTATSEDAVLVRMVFLLVRGDLHLRKHQSENPEEGDAA